MAKDKEEELFIPKTKHKALKIIFAILLIGALIAGGYFLYQYKFNNPKSIVSTLIDEAKESYQNKLNEITNLQKYKVDGHIKFDSNIDDETYKIIKDIELLFDGEIDTKEEISNFDINTKYKTDELANIKVYREKGTSYVLFNGVYDKYLKIDNTQDNEDIPTINITSSKDVYVIYNSLLKALGNEIEKLDFKQSNETITINNKETKVLNNYVELKDKEVNNFVKSMVKTLLNDKDFIEAMSNVSQTSYKEKLEETLVGIDEEEFKGVYRMNFYTDKGLLKKKLVSVRQAFNVEGIVLNVNVDKISDEEVLMSVNTMGIGYSVNIKTSKNTMNMVFSINAMGQYINFDISMNYEEIKEVSKENITDSKDINSLTDKEKEDIENKLKSNKALLQLIDNIKNINQKEV